MTANHADIARIAAETIMPEQGVSPYLESRVEKLFKSEIAAACKLEQTYKMRYVHITSLVDTHDWARVVHALWADADYPQHSKDIFKSDGTPKQDSALETLELFKDRQNWSKYNLSRLYTADIGGMSALAALENFTSNDYKSVLAMPLNLISLKNAGVV